MRSTVLVLLCTAPLLLVAQCVADAGRDTVLCNALMAPEPLLLGGIPSASGGAVPYTYAWSASYVYVLGNTTHHITASDMLDDTTAANPYLVSAWDDLYYVLTVTDAEGSVCVDSVFVRLSWMGVHLGTITYYVAPGDSVQLVEPNVSGGVEPLSVQWYPAADLDDPSALHPWASPDLSTSYGAVVTDALGCSLDGGTFAHVVVQPVHVEENQGERWVSVGPVPVHDEAVVRFAEDLLGGTFSLFTLDGRWLRAERIERITCNFERDDLPSGLYVWEARSAQDRCVRGRVVLE
ncbi:MAG TPA: hypothetical protein VGE21_16105 [Flavobacteriales bacterium]